MIWDPLEESARALRFGRIRVELVVQKGRVVKVIQQETSREWTLQDLEKPLDTPGSSLVS